jgi:hypothetical protein
MDKNSFENYIGRLIYDYRYTKVCEIVAYDYRQNVLISQCISWQQYYSSNEYNNSYEVVDNVADITEAGLIVASINDKINAAKAGNDLFTELLEKTGKSNEYNKLIRRLFNTLNGYKYIKKSHVEEKKKYEKGIRRIKKRLYKYLNNNYKVDRLVDIAKDISMVYFDATDITNTTETTEYKLKYTLEEIKRLDKNYKHKVENMK